MSQSPSFAVTADALHKRYGGSRRRPAVDAVNDVSFTIPAGTIFGLLGPNGAGKSTTVKMLTTLSTPTSGHATICGHDVETDAHTVRHLIGYVSQKSCFDPMGTGLENLMLAGRIHGMSGTAAKRRAGELLERFSLADVANRLAKTYSGGMARKLDVATGIMHEPAVLFLDEPTTGLDPAARADMWAEIERLAQAGTTVVLTTHYLDEADRLAQDVAIIDSGRIVAHGSPEQLKDSLRGDAVVFTLRTPGDADAAEFILRTSPGIADVTRDKSTVRGRTDAGAALLPPLLSHFEAQGVGVQSAAIVRPNLDDVYMRYTGKTMMITDQEATR